MLMVLEGGGSPQHVWKGERVQDRIYRKNDSWQVSRMVGGQRLKEEGLLKVWIMAWGMRRCVW